MAKPTPLVRRRHHAYLAQMGRCYYCGLPMWEDDLESFCRDNNISPSQAVHLRCTAEHLLARQDGGRDAADNIVAACQWCNQGRHRRKEPPEPPVYRHLVHKRLRAGRWHPPALLTAFKVLLADHNHQAQGAS